ncbi:MAG: 30S ribosomal protein S7 [Alphaproteobacteria bacterium]|jgi:small subunit ribosomal protein S7
MARRRKAIIRTIHADVKYNDLVVSKFINYVMRSGKKGVAESIVYKTIDLLGDKAKSEAPLEVLKSAIENVRPAVEVKSRRVGGATYQIPCEVKENRSLALGIRWLINAANARKEKTMFEKLANELMEAFNQKGAAVKKREETHKMAEANRGFAHFKW